MKIGEIKHIYSVEGIRITLIWTLAGFCIFLLESVFRLSFNVKAGWLVSGLAYIIPPFVFGYPFALIQLSLDGKRTLFSLTFMFLLKTMLYLLGILAAYYLVRQVIDQIAPNTFIGYYFELKFMLIWGSFLVVFLNVRYMFSHFEKKTISAWLSGEFYQPSQEERIFLFIDINSATSIAEKIASKDYFHYLNDFRSIVERAVVKYQGEIFQYVGDEVVISWKTAFGVKDNNAIQLFFEIQQSLEKRNGYFIKRYGYPVSIKGALHVGEVTKGELGMDKKDFAFVGDVLNTTSRMYGICRKENVGLVISKQLMQRFTQLEKFHPVSKGCFELKGKEDKIHIYGLSAPNSESVKV